MIRTYTELSKLKTFEERFEYLKLDGKVGNETFGFDRYLNQILYKSSEWNRVRSIVILRDGGCNLGIEDREIHSRIIIHHMNPLTEEDILNHSDIVLDPEFLITTTIDTHNAIHFGRVTKIEKPVIERRINDTSPWLL